MELELWTFHMQTHGTWKHSTESFLCPQVCERCARPNPEAFGGDVISMVKHHCLYLEGWLVSWDGGLSIASCGSWARVQPRGLPDQVYQCDPGAIAALSPLLQPLLLHFKEGAGWPPSEISFTVDDGRLVLLGTGSHVITPWGNPLGNIMVFSAHFPTGFFFFPFYIQLVIS